MTGARLGLDRQPRCDQLVCVVDELASFLHVAVSQRRPSVEILTVVDDRRHVSQEGHRLSVLDGHRGVATQAHAYAFPHRDRPHKDIRADLNERALISHGRGGQVPFGRQDGIPVVSTSYLPLGNERLGQQFSGLIEKPPEFLQVASPPIVPQLLPLGGPRPTRSYHRHAKRDRAGHQDGDVAHKLSVEADSVKSLEVEP
jgi:hypothetical protein